MKATDRRPLQGIHPVYSMPTDVPYLVRNLQVLEPGRSWRMPTYCCRFGAPHLVRVDDSGRLHCSCRSGRSTCKHRLAVLMRLGALGICDECATKTARLWHRAILRDLEYRLDGEWFTGTFCPYHLQWVLGWLEREGIKDYHLKDAYCPCGCSVEDAS